MTLLKLGSDYIRHMTLPNRHRTLAILITLALGFSGNICKADQNDPRLPKLFESLKSATDAKTAQVTASDIWRIWSEKPDDKRIAELLRQGTEQMNAGQLRKAEKLFTLVINAAPDFAEAWNKRATVLYLLGEFKKSQQDIDKVLELEERHFGALAGQGLVNIQLKNYEKALNSYIKVQEIYPSMKSPKIMIKEIKMLIKKQSI